MAIIKIDNKAYEVKAGKNLLEACLTIGLDLPYFCWHPAMGSVGACRQCAVKVYKDEQDTTGRLVMSCMESVRDNLILSIQDSTSKAFRAQNIEWLMTNHPHDCAVCDEGGSCHLQDMTVMTGHNYRRFAYKKRTYKNQYLGPFINHEMNRCIQCYRCVRFYKDYAGGDDLNVFAAHDHVYFGRESDGVLENEFSGNLAEVCPTGVFTDKTLKEHYTRKWDMTSAPSICQHCSLGCNTIAGERYGELRQITSRYNGEVNGYFICDRGRFGYEFVNSINRISQPLIRSQVPDAVDKQTAQQHLLEIINERSTIGIGSPRASLESNFALMQLVGKDNFYQGIPEKEAQLMNLVLSTLNSGNVHVPSIREAEESDMILILGEDLTNSAPRLALALRQAVRQEPLENASKINIPEWHDMAQRDFIQDQKGKLFIAYPAQTKLDDVASGIMHISPDDIARLGYAVANSLNKAAPAAGGMDKDTLQLARNIAESLKSAKKPLIIAGTGFYNEAIIKAASNIAFALGNDSKKANLIFVVPDCNSMGLAMMGAPSMEKATEKLKNKGNSAAIIVENDLYTRGTKEQTDQFLDSCGELIVLDHLNNATTNRADVLIPVGTFAEADGTLVNNEGRAQCFFQVHMPKNENIKETWRWLAEVRELKSGNNSEKTIIPGELMTELVETMPQFKGADTVAPKNDFRIIGQKIPREPHRYSGRTAMLANINVSEPKPPVDTDTPLSFTMEGYRGMPPPPLIPFFWSPGWNSEQSINKYQTEVGGPLKGGDPGKRLFAEASAGQPSFLNNVPEAFKASAGQWQILPLPHIFGSEELSIYTAGIEERAPKAYIAIGKADAEKLNIRESETIHLQIGTINYDLPVKIKEELAAGLAGIPDIAEFNGITWPATGILTKGKV
jgi:NADH-quinone oxidoreductase subunit G